ncbi:ras association domain-containing protein 8 isoform X2 [Fopius arisanus]|uniref:RASSF8_1 protein n=1 Tax=Fopius arisanus TaxID=64838 RepID=A0A0C9RHE7_9HYME|nr:PREDICTED: ras association domain-containing protein 8 isoform X2 [Fopius arisanus]
MELKVWVEGIQRIVCGVTESTTCQDVVYALAHATAQSGRFTLVERWRNNERFLAPYENPLTILMKWGEYSADVQLILRRSSADGTKNQNQSSTNSRSSYGTRSNGTQGNSLDPLVISRSHDNGRNNTTNSTSECNDSPEVLKRNRDIRKSLTFSGIHGTSPEGNIENKDGLIRRNVQTSTDSPTRGSVGEGLFTVQQKKAREIPPYREPPGPENSPHRTLPPYRDPPPPIVTSPIRCHASETIPVSYSHLNGDEPSSPNHPKSKRNLNQEVQDSRNLMQNKSQNSQSPNMVTVAYTQRYAELIRLVNRQRDTINAQQVDLTKFDAEILYWENKNREHCNQVDYISQEINRIESTGRIIDEQINELVHTEEEGELVRQQEKTLKSEITLLRSKLANCETELLQCKNKIRLVMEELALEQHSMNRESDERMVMERKVVNEMERLQNDVEQAKRLAEHTNQAAEVLKQEVSKLEVAIVEKKMQVERLVADMKEANLQSLTVACQDEQIKHLLEGAQKPGSTRKMIGSPRQLETAVPTSKNPHGVWV